MGSEVAHGGADPGAEPLGRAGRPPGRRPRGTVLAISGFAAGLAGLLLAIRFATGFAGGLLVDTVFLGMAVSVVGTALSTAGAVRRHRDGAGARLALAGMLCGVVGALGPVVLFVHAVEQHVH